MTRVAVTTDRYDDVSGHFVRSGLQPVPLPCIRVRPAPPDRLEQARDQAARADLLMVTSPRVVSLLWPHGDMPDIETAAVGPSTATAVTAAGGRVIITGNAGLARLADLTTDLLSARRVVLAHAQGSDPVGLARLRETASDLSECVVYESSPVAPDLTPVEAVAFASPSAVMGWALSRGFDDVIVGAIGATTARAIDRYRRPDVIARTPSYPALAEAIATYLEVKV